MLQGYLRSSAAGLFALLAAAAPAATITTDFYDAREHRDVASLRVWEYSLETSDLVIQLNAELGEQGQVYLQRQQQPWVPIGAMTYMAWDMAVLGNTVDVIQRPYAWWRTWPQSEVVLDEEVAGRTHDLVAATVLNSQIHYRHYVTPFSMSYLEPFVFFGPQEKQKYLNLFDGGNVFIQNLGRYPSGRLMDISGHLVTEDNWVSYQRHKIAADQLALTVTDAELSQNLLFLRGEDEQLFQQPGTLPEIQARTVTLINDIRLPENSMIMRAPMPESGLFVELLSIDMACSGDSAVTAMNRILQQLATLSEQPARDGRYRLALSVLQQSLAPCLRGSSSKGK